MEDRVGRLALSDSDEQGEVERHRLRCRELEETNTRLTSQLRHFEVLERVCLTSYLHVYFFSKRVSREETRKATVSKNQYDSLHKEYNNLRGVCQEYQNKNEKLKQYGDFLQIPIEDVEMTGFQMGHGSYGGR